MGGQIWFESEENYGSTFYFTMPYVEADMSMQLIEPTYTPVAPIPQISTSAVVRNTRILVVDDTEDNRFLLLTYLKKYPFDVVQAENGLEAVEKFAEEPFDLILMDIQMPIMDGYAATQKIRQMERDKNTPPIPIIAVSANAMAEDIRKSLDAGCTEHVTKPIKKSVLIEMIQRYTI